MWLAAIESAFYGVLGLATGAFQAVAGLAVVVVAIGAPLGYFGVFGQTGADYFQWCWEKAAAEERSGISREPLATSARQGRRLGRM